jgi:hypothetical protein
MDIGRCSCSIHRSEDRRDYPKPSQDSIDFHTAMGCVMGFCFCGENPDSDLSSLGPRSVVRDGPRLAFSRFNVLGGTWDNERQLDGVEVTWDAIKRKFGESYSTDRSGDED